MPQTYSEQITALENSRAAALASMTDLMAKAAEDRRHARRRSRPRSYDEPGDAGQGASTPTSAACANSRRVQRDARRPRCHGGRRRRRRGRSCRSRPNVPQGHRVRARWPARSWSATATCYEAAEYAEAVGRFDAGSRALTSRPPSRPARPPMRPGRRRWSTRTSRATSSSCCGRRRSSARFPACARCRSTPRSRRRPPAGRTGGSGSQAEAGHQAGVQLETAGRHQGRRDHRADRGTGPAVESEGRGRWSAHDMIAGIAQFLDAQFIDPAVAAVAGVNPASRSPTARRRPRRRPIRWPTSWG